MEFLSLLLFNSANFLLWSQDPPSLVPVMHVWTHSNDYFRWLQNSRGLLNWAFLRVRFSAICFSFHPRLPSLLSSPTTGLPVTSSLMSTTPSSQLLLGGHIEALSHDLHFQMSSNRFFINSQTQFIWFGNHQQLQKPDFALLLESFPLFTFSFSVRAYDCV